MAKTPTSPQSQPFHRRPGVDPFGPAGWADVNTEDDPGSLLPNELQVGENIRKLGRIYETRPGLVQILDLGLGPSNADNHVTFLAQAPVDNPRVRLWSAARGCFGAGVSTGGTIFHVDPTEVPVLQTYSQFFTAADFQLPMAQFGDRLFVGDRTELREIVLTTAHPGVSISRLLTSPSQSSVASFPNYVIRCLKEFDGLLFIGLEDVNTITNSKIVVWDGLSVKDDLTGIRPALAFGIWRDKLVAGFDATAGNIRVRNPGVAPGTWNTFALAGYRTAAFGNAMAEERTKLYIASGIGDIYSFDGASLVVAHNIATAVVDGNGVTALTLHNGLLYYGWNSTGASYISSIGKHDPDSTANEWVDSYKLITTGISANFKRLSSLLSYRGQIYAGGQQMWLVATAENNVQGVLELINDTGAPGAGFVIEQLLRFP